MNKYDIRQLFDTGKIDEVIHQIFGATAKV